MNSLRRKIVNQLMIGLAALSVLVALVPLILIFLHLISKGLASLDYAFFTQLPKPVGEPGSGMAHAMLGTLVHVGVGFMMALPLGLLGGIYLAEYGIGPLAAAVRFSAEMLNGTPSIVIGIFAYALIVVPMGNFSAVAGSVALAIIMLPMIIRTTEEMMKLVPVPLREGALALGVPSWKTFLFIVLKTARGGIITGVLLAMARSAGETAPLLFTSLGNQFWNIKLTEPMAALPLQIYTYAISPFEEWRQDAWAGSLVLMGMVLLLSVLGRMILGKRMERH